jgi:hypothetical protein
MKVIRIPMIFLLILLIHAAAAYGHRPVMIKNKSSKDQPVLVDEPEISWAYYGILEGEPHYYMIESSESFNLYVNILVPDFHPDGEPILRHDMSFKIFVKDKLLYTGEGLKNDWHRFYEKYGKDHYYWGPEFDQNVEAGTYEVLVYNSANIGKYALAIGKIEKFNFLSIMGAIAKAKYLDMWFFKSNAK